MSTSYPYAMQSDEAPKADRAAPGPDNRAAGNTNLMDPKIKELLEDIQSWMTDNDYECGDEGSLIWDRITEALVTEAQKKAE